MFEVQKNEIATCYVAYAIAVSLNCQAQNVSTFRSKN